MPTDPTPVPRRRSEDAPDRADKQSIDIDDAMIDETASVDPDEELPDIANPKEPAEQKDLWRERDANRRAHGPDDLKA